MRDRADRHTRDRVWFFSPAIATAVFFALKLVLGASGPASSPDVAGAGAETPVAIPVQVRVVSQVRRADDSARVKRVVPKTEADLIRLFEQEGTVTFLSDEVEVVATPSKEFAPLEVDVITSDRLRQARLLEEPRADRSAPH